MGSFPPTPQESSLVSGIKITVPYHKPTGLSLLTSVGITTCQTYCAEVQAYTSTCTQQNPNKETVSASQYLNMTQAQRLCLTLHERWNHANMHQLNQWIRAEHFIIDPTIANSTDPICTFCQYVRAKWKAHTNDKGSITALHKFLGAKVSTDQMEASYPGKMLTTRGYQHLYATNTAISG